MSKVPVASCTPRENSSGARGARSTYCPVRLAVRPQGRSFSTPIEPLIGVKSAIAGCSWPDRSPIGRKPPENPAPRR